jgi:hypothetical protein
VTTTLSFCLSCLLDVVKLVQSLMRGASSSTAVIVLFVFFYLKVWPQNRKKCMYVCMYVCTQGVLNDFFQLWSFYLVSGVVWILEWKRVPSSDTSLVQRTLHFVMSEMWYIPHIPLGRRIWHCFLRNSHSS